MRSSARHLATVLLGLGLMPVLAVGGACSGDIMDPDMDPPTGPTLPPFSPAPGNLHRLTVAQYQNTVRDLLGDDITVPTELEADTSLNGFIAIGASRTTISRVAAEQFEVAAYDLAAQALDPARRDRIVACTPAGTSDDGCAGEVVRDFGGRAWRRPLTDEEVARYTAIAAQAATTLGDFYAGLEFAVAGLLMSPNFLFRVELGDPDGDRRKYDDWEMASRISYFLWNTTPDAELLEAASRGELSTAEQVRAQTARLLESPRAEEAIRNFYDELLELHGLDSLRKDEVLFPAAASPTLGASMREETLRTLTWLTFDQDRSWGEIFDTRTTFVNDELARLYGHPEPAPGEWMRVEHPEDGMRSGILGHAGILALYSHATQTSATLRGKFVRNVLLCHAIPPPPPSVVTVLPSGEELHTARERLEAHRENPVCAGCHSRMDPIGLALENFDAIGAWRDTDDGYAIDPSGDLDGIPFADARELGGILAAHPDVGPCLVRKMYRYATGHIETTGEGRTLADLTDRFLASDQSVRTLMIEIVASDGFRYAGEPR